MADILKDLDWLEENSAHDFLGTGSNGAAAQKDEDEWWAVFNRVRTSIKKIEGLKTKYTKELEDAEKLSGDAAYAAKNIFKRVIRDLEDVQKTV